MRVVLLALALSQAVAPRAWVLDAGASRLEFGVRHPLHAVAGRAKEVEARAVLAPDGRLQAMVRTPVASFDTGDGNRDSDLRTAMEASRFPFVVFKGTGRLSLPATLPAKVTLPMQGEIEVHGVKRPVEVPLTVELGEGGSARVTGAFDLSLDAHGVQRPSLLFRKIDDRCRIALDLSMRPEER
jgi:polyisoprenoid-binding protein YceI